jgi:hypothetical protein
LFDYDDGDVCHAAGLCWVMMLTNVMLLVIAWRFTRQD